MFDWPKFSAAFSESLAFVMLNSARNPVLWRNRMQSRGEIASRHGVFQRQKLAGSSKAATKRWFRDLSSHTLLLQPTARHTTKAIHTTTTCLSKTQTTTRQQTQQHASTHNNSSDAFTGGGAGSRETMGIASLSNGPTSRRPARSCPKTTIARCGIAKGWGV